MNLNWRETGYSPDLMGAWLCDAGDRELVVLQRSSVLQCGALDRGTVEWH